MSETAPSSSNARRGSWMGSNGCAEAGSPRSCSICALPDSRGIPAFEQVWWVAPLVPILVIGSQEDQDVALLAVERGVQDSLRRDRPDSYTLPRALTCIIERTAAEEALFFEQRRADVTLKSVGDAVLSIDVSGTVTDLNPVAERVTGWARREAVGRPLSEVFQIIDATTREPARNPLDQGSSFPATWAAWRGAVRSTCKRANDSGRALCPPAHGRRR